MSDTTRPEHEVTSGWRRLARMGRPRLTRANLLGTILALGLGFAIAAQVQQTQTEGLDGLRPDELVRILDNVTQSNNRLSAEIAELEDTRRALEGEGDSAEAIAAAQQRVDTLGILAGTVPARGPGIALTITDPDGKITAPLLLDALQELRDAGAEAVQINGVRVVANTYFSDLDGRVTVGGQRISAPYTFLVIGDPATMASAMDIPGGVTETIRSRGGGSTIDQRTTVDITALHEVVGPRYAQPVPPTAAPTP